MSKKMHISGIGGTAMVAGARLALEAGWEVRGSDNPMYPPGSTMVEALGVPVAEGYAAENLDWDPDVVLLGNVLSRGNVEVETTLERRMRYMSLPEWLKEEVLRPRRPVVVCGTHGKTTTTTLTAHVLDACGLNPGYLIGGQPLGFEHPARLSDEGTPFVIEGDEYDTAFFDKRAKFFHYLPEIAVVTSLEFDHGDIYNTMEDIEIAFQRMLRQIPANGWLVACADNHAASLLPHAFGPVCTYGFDKDADWRGEVLGSNDGHQRMAVYHEGLFWGEVEAPVAGRHNLQNVLASIVVAALLGAEQDAIAAGVRSFPGVRRRMEIFLEAEGIVFVDDFAHHPTAIRETIAAARERWPERRIQVLFEPRSNTTVTNTFQDDLEAAFLQADSLWLGPIYREERIPEPTRLDRERLCAGLREQGVNAHAAISTEAIFDAVVEHGQAGDLILILSNGAFGGIYGQFRSHYGDGVH